MENFRKELIKLINESNLPLDAAYYVLKDVYRDMKDTYQSYLDNLEVQKNNEQDKEKTE